MESLEETLLRAKSALTIFKESLGWNKKKTLKQCLHDPSHFISSNNLEFHQQKCKWKKLGYTKDETEAILTSPPKRVSIKLEDVLKKALPGINISHESLLTDDRYTSLLTPDQRLAVYNETIAQLKTNSKQNCQEPVSFEDEDQLDWNKNEKGTEFRRKKQTYRAKNVHITKRSYTEVLRDVISVHTSKLEHFQNQTSSQQSSEIKDTRKCDNSSDNCVEPTRPQSRDKLKKKKSKKVKKHKIKSNKSSKKNKQKHQLKKHKTKK